jgi:plasmid replication initiation protein
MLIPTITLTLSPEFESLEKLMESQAKDKIKYIEKVTFTFSPELFTGMLSYGGGFIQPDKSVRNRFNSVYSWRFELFIRSTIIGNKKWNNMLRFPIFGDDRLNLQKILGVNYKTYGKFKEKVLDVVIEDINSFTNDLRISYTPVKEGRKVVGVVFDVESPLTGEIDNRNFTLDYYIAVQHFFFSGKVNTFESLEQYHEWLKTEGMNSVYKGKIAEWDKTIHEWEEEFDIEKPAYEKLVRLWVSKEETIESKKPDIAICPIKLCLTMKNGDDFFAFDTAKITKPSQSLKYLEEIL